MKKHLWLDWTTKYNDHKITVDFPSHKLGQPVFRSETLEGKEYETEATLISALDRYDLALRKGFKNPTAYRAARNWSFDSRPVSFETVTVTSVIDDKEAWIKTPAGDRQKVKLDTLYTDLEELKKFHKASNTLRAECEKKIQQMQEELNKLSWKPQS